MKKNVLLLFFISILTKVWGMDADSSVFKIQTKNDDLPSILKKIMDDDFIYDEEGFLTLHGQWTGLERPIHLFFKKASYNCTNNDFQSGVYFDFAICAGPGESVCEEGIKLCYESELSNEKIMTKKKSTHTMNKVNSFIDCGKKELHVLKISIGKDYEQGVLKRMVRIESSIDRNKYVFALRDPCFKIRAGTKNSIATLITDLDDKQIEVSPILETLKGDWLNGWTKKMDNLNLFALDFIPMKDKRLYNYGDYYKQFWYIGGGEECKMTMKFGGDPLFVCKSKYVKNRVLCKGPSRIKRQAPPGTIECTATDTKDESLIKTSIGRNEDTTGEWSRDENMENGYNSDISFSLSIPNPHPYIPISAVSIPITLEKIERYTKKTTGSKRENAIEQAVESLVSGTTASSSSRKYHAYFGEEIIEEELVIECNGWIFKTGHTRATVIKKTRN